MIMTTSLEATDRDFEQMMQMLTGAWVTQIAGAVATYSIADHLAKGPATAEQIAAPLMPSLAAGWLEDWGAGGIHHKVLTVL